MTLDLLEARMEFLHLAQPSVAYCREHGLDWSSIEAATGGIYLAPIRPVAPRCFDFDPEGRLAVVAEVFDEHGATIDLVAWSISDPRRVATMFGRAPALGMAVAVNPATYFNNAPLKLYRTPLAWLKAQCDGAVLLDAERGAWWLLHLPASKFGAEDDAHAAELETARAAVLGEQSFLVPARPKPDQQRAA